MRGMQMDHDTTSKQDQDKGTSTPLPNLILESIQDGVGVFDILLCLLPHVENRAVSTCTEDVLEPTNICQFPIFRWS